MATIQWDMLAEDQVELTQRGKSYVRTGLVEGLTGTDMESLENALVALGVPGHGYASPTSVASVVSRVNVRHVKDSPSKAKVTVRFDPINLPNLTDLPPSLSTRPEYEVSTTVQDVQTNMDINGNLIKLIHTPSVQDPEAEPGTTDIIPGMTIEQTGVVGVQKPVTRISARRREPRNPLDKSMAFVGRVHVSRQAAGRPRSFLRRGDRFWLCAGIRGRGNDVSGWEVYYDFVLSEDYQWIRPQPGAPKEKTLVSGWDPVVVFIDPETGTYVHNPLWKGEGANEWKDDESIKRVQVLPGADMTLLNL